MPFFGEAQSGSNRVRVCSANINSLGSSWLSLTLPRIERMKRGNSCVEIWVLVHLYGGAIWCYVSQRIQDSKFSVRAQLDMHSPQSHPEPRQPWQVVWNQRAPFRLACLYSFGIWWHQQTYMTPLLPNTAVSSQGSALPKPRRTLHTNARPTVNDSEPFTTLPPSTAVGFPQGRQPALHQSFPSRDPPGHHEASLGASLATALLPPFVPFQSAPHMVSFFTITPWI